MDPSTITPPYNEEVSFLPVDEQLAYLKKGFAEIIREEDLKERLIQTLYQKGGSLKQVPKEESVTIIMFIEDRNFMDEENQNKTFILSATRKDLEELAQGEDRSREFRQRMKIIEY